MSLPAAARTHHTAWVDVGERTVAVRYANDDKGRLVCFGDDGLAGTPDGASVGVTIREIQNGPTIASFSAIVRELRPEDVSLFLVSEVIGHREPRGGYNAERRGRRLVALQA